MKVKLLKKVRKRYKITKIVELASNSSLIFKQWANDYGLPFYIVTDDGDDDRYMRFSRNERHRIKKYEAYQYFDEAYQCLCRWIIKDYGEKFRHKDGKKEQVWWVK